MASHPIKVLFVEDEETLRRSYSRFFVDKYLMDFAANGAEGIAKAETFQPQVLVLDLRLPDTDGIEVMRKLRRSQPTLPVIITTAYVSMEPLVSMLSFGHTTFLNKPFDLQELGAKIDEAARTASAA